MTHEVALQGGGLAKYFVALVDVALISLHLVPRICIHLVQGVVPATGHILEVQIHFEVLNCHG